MCLNKFTIKKTIIILSIFAAVACGCGNVTKTQAKATSNETTADNASATDEREKYTIASFDYSSVWMKYTETDHEYDDWDIVYNGIIGASYQRIQIIFLTVERSGTDLGLYNVTGKSKVNNNICSFEGYLQVEEVETYDGDYDTPEAYGGSLRGRYQLRENKEEKHSGIFEGKFLTLFDVTEKDGNKITNMHTGQYIAEGLNDFTGTWTPYQTDKSKICNWGWRIPPNAPDLFRHRENEAYDFNYKYLNMGWKSYVYGGGFLVTDFNTGKDIEEENESTQALEEKQNMYRKIENQKMVATTIKFLSPTNCRKLSEA